MKKLNLVKLFLISLALLGFVVFNAADSQAISAPNEIGVVLLHGKGGDTRWIDPLVRGGFRTYSGDKLPDHALNFSSILPVEKRSSPLLMLPILSAMHLNKDGQISVHLMFAFSAGTAYYLGNW